VSRPGGQQIRRFGLVAIAVALVVAGAGCASSGGTASPPGTLRVVASFYPLQYAAQRVGGAFVSVRNLTPVGAEPHDLELSAQDTANLEDAGLVVYLKGFSPAVDESVAAVAGGHALDVATAANLDLRYTAIEGGQQASTSSIDPHFWLDPTRLAAVGDAIARQLAARAPQHAAAFMANAAALRADLGVLDTEYRTGLAHCANPDIVTSHNAFGYLAEHYGLRQIGISGLTPEDEPTPQQLADAADFVRVHHVSTIYYETLVSPAIAKTVANETGVKTAVLDPIEGLSSTSQGADYLAVMRSNLASLRAGQGCT